MWNVTDWQTVVFSDESRFVLWTDDNHVRQDNARPHTARVAEDFLRHFQTFAWPARSPDLSPVEHVWDQLKRQMTSCHSVQDLELAVQDLWTHLPEDNIRCLINSMPGRVVAFIAAGGGPTRYCLRYSTPCIRVIVLFLRSNESLICVIMCIKFHFNPMLSSWVAIFNVPECILKLDDCANQGRCLISSLCSSNHD
ncbi:hypothetical protein TNCV_561501 [Trichonephila clavipes]|uniref:Tc1-like transposase DDE domain-containing protein n=1 Tax=Trichonephila clavipes TaxID=2585209 RepID=A0A8X6VEJ9_TRICX|nr:hypothetical protein TNCV_561501 [Trichonephila clavipes]